MRETNTHNPPTPTEVRATLWQTNQRLREDLDRTRQLLEAVIAAYDDGTDQLAASITAAEKYLEETKCNRP